jgi:hypothetical protein
MSRRGMPSVLSDVAADVRRTCEEAPLTRVEGLCYVDEWLVCATWRGAGRSATTSSEYTASNPVRQVG